MRRPFIPASTPHHHTIRYRRDRANQKTLHSARCHFCEKLRQGQSASRCCIHILVGSFGSSVVSPGAERAHAGRNNMSSAQTVGHRRCERAVDHMQDKGTCHCLDNQTRQTITALSLARQAAISIRVIGARESSLLCSTSRSLACRSARARTLPCCRATRALGHSL